MRITLLGVLSIVGVLVLLTYIGQQIERKRNGTKETNEQTRDQRKGNPDSTDTV